MTRAADVLLRLEGVRKSGSGWSAKCPAHEDRRASLSVTETDNGELLMHCHAGCSFAQILEAIGGPVKSDGRPTTKMPEPSAPKVYTGPLDAALTVTRAAGSHITGEWTYRDAKGEVAFMVYRFDDADGKTYLPASPVDGGWTISLPPDPRPLYRLPELLASSGTVIVVEGEKVADAAVALGLNATTSQGGADASSKSDWSPLAGRDVVVFPDNDPPNKKTGVRPGIRYAKAVAKTLAALTPPANVKIVEIPGLPLNGDLFDYVAQQRILRVGDQQIREYIEQLISSASPPKTFAEELSVGLKRDPGHAWERIDQITEVFASKDRAEWTRVARVLRKEGLLKDIELEARKRTGKVKPLRAIDGGGEPRAQDAVLSVLPDAPVPEEAKVPDGWVLLADSDSGKPALQRLVAKKIDGQDAVIPIPVAHNPIVISAWLANRSTGGKMLEVSWRAGGKWHSRVAPREKLMAAQQIVATLATHGFPVSSNNAQDLVAYLCDYERCNVRHAIPVRNFADHLGWQPDGGFIVGYERIGCAETVFQGADGGDQAVAERFHARGTFDGWRAAVSVVRQWPKVELALYASLSAPLLEMLRAPSFVIDWAGGSSTGKTTTLCVGASCWGVPDERDPLSLVVSWATTDVGIERYAALLGSLPLFLDESKRAKVVGGKSMAPEIIYALANGQGKARGSKTGLQSVRHWRTVVLTNGEQSLIRMSRDGGLAGRVLTLWGSPFGGFNPAVAGLTRSLSEHYGHAGPAFVRWLVDHRDKLPQWQARLSELEAIYTVRLDHAGSGAPTRLATYLATLELCAELAHPALSFPWIYVSPISRCCDEIAGKSAAVDRSKEALDWVFSVAVAHQAEFCGRHYGSDESVERSPSRGWAGVWSSGDSWDSIKFLPSWLEKTLTDGGFDYDSTVQHWADKGLLISSGDHSRRQLKTSIDGIKCWTVALKRSAFPTEDTDGNQMDLKV